jgi:hypothetical protein
MTSIILEEKSSIRFVVFFERNNIWIGTNKKQEMKVNKVGAFFSTIVQLFFNTVMDDLMPT